MAVGRAGCADFKRWYSKNSDSDINFPPFGIVEAAPSADGDGSAAQVISGWLDTLKPTPTLGGT